MTSDSKDSPKRSKKKREASQSPESSKKLKPDNEKKRFSSRHSKEEKGTKSKAFVDLDKPQERYPRYYGEDSEKRKNSDRYWNKYARDDNQVGNRYYGDKPRERRNDSFEEPAPKPRERKQIDDLTSRTGGAYIPPAKLRLMQAEITDKSSTAYQRIAWEALKKSIHGFINKVNISNIAIIAKELLHENIVRGRGLLSKSIIQAQAASPTFSNVYAALVSIINSKFPNIGELLLNRLVLQFKRGFKQNNKTLCISSATFIAHLVNQGVAHEILSLEILTLLVESPTDDSVEVAISFLKECGQKLTEVSSKGINAIFEMLRNILHEGQLEKRIQYMIEVMFQIRKDGFKDHAAVVEDLDLVEEEDQFTHLITLDDVKQTTSQDILNVFKFDDKYEENEGKYKTLSKEILDFTDSESGSGSEESDVGSEEDEEGAEGDEDKDKTMIIDKTDTNLITLRRTIYLTMQSSLDYEECTHKLLKMELKPGQEIELCHMILDCCAEQRTYEKFFGLVAQRFCQINKIYIQPFQQIFKDTYATTHRLDANRLRNVSKFFAHLLFTDAIGWDVLETMKLNEEDTNSSSRIFIKILCQELAEYMGLGKLNTRLKDETLQSYFAGLFPRDNPKNTRFSINFFTSIGLGGLTDELRQHLKSVSKVTQVNLVEESESSSSSSSSGSSSDEESSSSESSSSNDEDKKKSRNKPQERSRPDKTRENRKSSVSDDKHKKRSKSHEERKESKNKFRGNLESDKHQYKKDHVTGQGRHEDKLKQSKGKKDTSSSSRDEKRRPKISNQDNSQHKHRRDRDRS